MFAHMMMSRVFGYVYRRDDAGVSGGMAHAVRVHHAAATGGVRRRVRDPLPLDAPR